MRLRRPLITRAQHLIQFYTPLQELSIFRFFSIVQTSLGQCIELLRRVEVRRPLSTGSTSFKSAGHCRPRTYPSRHLGICSLPLASFIAAGARSNPSLQGGRQPRDWRDNCMQCLAAGKIRPSDKVSLFRRLGCYCLDFAPIEISRSA